MRATVLIAVVLSSFYSTQVSAHEPELVLAFDPSLGELPESIALDAAGNRYLSMADSIEKVTPDGERTTFGTLPIPVFALGVKVGPDGCVYTVSTSLDPTVPGAYAWRICEPGEVEEIAELDHAGGPNDLAFDDQANIFVTDTLLGQIWRIDELGHAEVWLQDPSLQGDPDDPALVIAAMGANGIAFDRKQRNLFVGNLDQGCIVRIERTKDGAPGAIEDFACDPRLRGADGMAFDISGKLWVTVGTQDAIVEVDRKGRVSVVAEGGALHGPSSIAFGTTKDDKHAVYITNLDFLRGFGIVPGMAEPGLLRMTVRPKGLPLFH